MIRINNIKISVKDEPTKEILKEKCAKALSIPAEKILKAEIFRKSVDSRNKNDVFFVFAMDISVNNEDKLLKKLAKNKNISKANEYIYTIPFSNSDIRPAVIGFGPAGMFAALYLARAGLKPIVLERGKNARDRKKDIDKFFESGILDTSSNVQFGEGGAGTFSDGKLTTNIKDKRCRYITKELVRFGAPEEIIYAAKPHIGTDNLINVVQSIREEIISLGGEVRFSSAVTDIYADNGKLSALKINSPDGEYYLETSYAIAAIGHSARDTFEMLVNKPLLITQKPFAVGVRIEHSQKMINTSQYGEFARYLPAADYKLVSHLKNGRSVYTFCMCPGGYVVAAASEENRVAVNGMSYFARSGENSNAALLVGVSPDDIENDDPLGGMYFQRELESRAFIAGGGEYKAPAQLAGDFLCGKASREILGIKPTYRPSVTLTDISPVFPEYISESLRLAISDMGRKIKGFDSPDSILTAVESRSSSPIRINRAENFEAVGLSGFYPCGEGCGYAGGIISAAADGLKCAEALFYKIKRK